MTQQTEITDLAQRITLTCLVCYNVLIYYVINLPWMQFVMLILYCDAVKNKYVYLLLGYWTSPLSPSLCEWLQHRMGSNLGDIIDTWFSLYYFHWWKNIWSETWKRNISSYIYKYYIVLACIIWEDSCTGISRWELCWTYHNHIVVLFVSPWNCLCPSKWIFILQDIFTHFISIF